MTNDNQPEILTVPQAAAMLQTSRNMVYILIRRGDLKAIRLGRKEFRIMRREILRFCTDGHKKKHRGGRNPLVREAAL